MEEVESKDWMGSSVDPPSFGQGMKFYSFTYGFIVVCGAHVPFCRIRTKVLEYLPLLLTETLKPTVSDFSLPILDFFMKICY